MSVELQPTKGEPMNIAYRMIAPWMIKALAQNLDTASQKDTQYIGTFSVEQAISYSISYSEYCWCAFETDGRVYGIGGMTETGCVWLLTSNHLKEASNLVRYKFAKAILKNLRFFFKNSESEWVYNHIYKGSEHYEVLIRLGARFRPYDDEQDYFELHKEEVCGQL